ncbi:MULTISPECIES: hypothetical protein [unclassified Acinetobacter]|uniref:hypothetical protein n=1 Tax=unclassified Acinetobacter TaxID=196816 RepID=UPI0020B2FE43|nr:MULTISPECIES: hypothetical protein [unclassified Acinetobacter]
MLYVIFKTINHIRMRNYHLTKKEGILVVETKQELYSALFGSVNFPRNLSIFFVCLSLSLVMATLFVHECWFPTSQSRGMTNYHRWLYDVYVVISILIVPLVYLRFRKQITNITFRQKWNAYIRAYAQYQFKLKEVVENIDDDRTGQQKRTNSMLRYFLKHKWFQYILIVSCIYGCIAMYIWVTPFVSTRGSSFWILTWWPINALIIGVLYYIQFPLFLHLLSIKEVNQHYRILHQRASRDNSTNTVEKLTH